MPPKLVIFDCDGVLVDTEALANDHMAAVFADIGLALTGPECRRMFQGKTMEDVCQQVADLIGQAYDPALPGRIRARVEGVLADGVAPIAGAVELVRRMIANDISFCVASSGSVPKMHLTLGSVGLLPLMKDVLFSAQDIGRGKPHPDVFLAAAAAMNQNCADAVVIEDSLSGVQAGMACGARVLGYAGDPFTDAAALRDAGAEVFHHMADVDALIGLN